MAEAADFPLESSIQWDETSRETIDGLTQVGAAYGDDEALMRAKATRVCQLLREMLEDAPSLQITATLPADFTDSQIEVVSSVIQKAAAAGVQVAMNHAAEALANAMYDLCTSKLKEATN